MSGVGVGECEGDTAAGEPGRERVRSARTAGIVGSTGGDKGREVNEENRRAVTEGAGTEGRVERDDDSDDDAAEEVEDGAGGAGAERGGEPARVRAMMSEL